MSGSDLPSNCDGLGPLTGWTMVNSQGSIVSGDEGSETSDSSIEIVSPDGVGDFDQENSGSTHEHIEGTEDQCSSSPSECTIEPHEVISAIAGQLFVERSSEPDNLPDEAKRQNDILNSSCAYKNNDEELDFQSKDQPHLNMQEDDESPIKDNQETGLNNTVVQSLDYQQEAKDIVTGSDGTNNSDTILLGACSAEWLHQEGLGDHQNNTEYNQQKESDLENKEFKNDFSVLNTEIDEEEGSGSDSDFICLDPEHPGEMDQVLFANGHEPLIEGRKDEVGEKGTERVLLPLRFSCPRSSISPEFDFMRDLNKRERYSDNGEGNSDEDTESCTGESLADRIESEQSEASDGLYPDDIGDLSSFDIGEIPLEAGDVARNYRHQPNRNLDSILNTMLIVSAILTMGISLGIMMATDLEIEEWQNAYEKEAQKVKIFEEQTKTLENLLKYYKKEALEMEEEVMANSERNTFFETMKEKAFRDDKGFYGILIKLQETLDTFMNYSKEEFAMGLSHGAMSDHMCGHATMKFKDRHLLTYDHWVSKIAILKQTAANYSLPVEPPSYPHDGLLVSDEPFMLSSMNHNLAGQKQFYFSDEVKSKYANSQNNLDYQNKMVGAEKDNIMERHRVHSITKKPNRDVSSAEDQFDNKDVVSVLVPLDTRQLQQSLTREQERALHWQQLYLTERRQREKERESEEWENEREREKELNQEDMDHVKCLQKLMSTNLTTLTQHVLRMNVSVFDDFANLSMLMSTVAELQQSVVESLHGVWQEAEEVMGRVNTETISGKLWAELPDREALISYFNTVVQHVKEDVEDTFRETRRDGVGVEPGYNEKLNNKVEQEKDVFGRKENLEEREGGGGGKRRFGRFSNLIKRTRKSVKKIGKKISGFLGKIQDALGNSGMWFSKIGNYFKNNPHGDNKKDQIEEDCAKSLNQWFKVGNDIFHVDVQHECVKWIRERWQYKLVQTPCQLFHCEPLDPSKSDREHLRLKEEGEKMSQRYTETLSFLLTKTKSFELYSDSYQAPSMVNRFLRFLVKWESSPLRLGVDSKWADCQLKWWNNDFFLKRKFNMVPENLCNWVSFENNLFSIHKRTLSLDNVISILKSFKFNTKRYKYFKDRKLNYEYDEVTKINSKKPSKNGTKNNDTTPFSTKKSQKDINFAARQSPYLDVEKLFFNIGSNKMQNKIESLDTYAKEKLAEWNFKRAADRDFHRKKDHQSDWMFERAEQRRSESEYRRKHDLNSDHIHSATNRKRPDWYVRQGQDRERIRKQNLKSNWNFERTEGREAYHKEMLHYDNNNDDDGHDEFDCGINKERQEFKYKNKRNAEKKRSYKCQKGNKFKHHYDKWEKKHKMKQRKNRGTRKEDNVRMSCGGRG